MNDMSDEGARMAMKIKVNNLEALLRNASLLKKKNSTNQRDLYASYLADKIVRENKK